MGLSEFRLLKVPVPLVAQLRLEKLVAVAPVRAYELPAQIVAFGTLTVGGVQIDKTIEVAAFGHTPPLKAVKANTTCPSWTSEALGV